MSPRPVAALLVAALLVAPVARADAPVANVDLAEEADLAFELGVKSYSEGKYLDALQHLLESNRLVPNKNVLYNIAATYERLGRYPEAWRHYSDYLALETDPEQRKPAEDAMAKMKKKVALVYVESDPPGSTVYFDRKDLGARGSTPRTFAVDPGVHTVLIARDGFSDAQPVTVDAQLGETGAVKAALEPILGRVDVKGEPPGAQIRIDKETSEVVGTLPGWIDAPPGSHVLVVSAPGYETSLQVVDIVPDQVTPALVKLDRQTGTLVVDAIERGALVTVDGQPSGFTPTVLTIATGEHDVRVSSVGYTPWEQHVSVQKESQAVVNARLRPLQEVTAASRSTQSIEDAPASVSVLTQQEIRAFGYQSLYEALDGTRGIFTTYDHSYQYVGFRGFSRLGNYNNRQLMTLDGHTLNDDNLGAAYLGEDLFADLKDVERIEVVRGPGSALYGTNAFSGVINVVTRKGETTNPTNVAISGDGPRNVRARAGVSHLWGDDAGFWLSAGGVVSQGTTLYVPEYDYGHPGTGDCDGDGVLDAVRCDGVSERADGFTTMSSTGKLWVGDFTLETYYNSRSKLVPNGSYGGIYGDDRNHTQDSRAAIEARFEPTLGENAKLLARAYVDHYELDSTFAYPERIANLWDGTWAGVEPRVQVGFGEALQLTAGVDAKYHLAGHLRGCVIEDPDHPSQCGDAAEEDVINDSTTTYAEVGSYVVADVTVGTIARAQVGGRFDYFTTVGSNFNPRLALILKPTERDGIKILAGTAYRAPSPYELNFHDDVLQFLPPDDNGDGVPDLTAERVRTAEVEYTHRFSDVTTASVGVYGNEITNVIDTIDIDAEAGTFRYANLPDALHSGGVELEIRRDWRQGTMLSLAWTAQRTVTGDLFKGDLISNSPEHVIAGKAAVPIGPVTLANRLIVEGPRVTDAGGFTNPAVKWDATLSGSVRAVQLDYGVGVRNALDWQYTQPTGPDVIYDQNTQLGRTFYASVTKSF